MKDDEEMRQLKDSISEYGVLNPLIVRPRPEGRPIRDVNFWVKLLSHVRLKDSPGKGKLLRGGMF